MLPFAPLEPILGSIVPSLGAVSARERSAVLRLSPKLIGSFDLETGRPSSLFELRRALTSEPQPTPWCRIDPLIDFSSRLALGAVLLVQNCESKANSHGSQAVCAGGRIQFCEREFMLGFSSSTPSWDHVRRE
jgi:hypothetical protein